MAACQSRSKTWDYFLWFARIRHPLLATGFLRRQHTRARLIMHNHFAMVSEHKSHYFRNKFSKSANFSLALLIKKRVVHKSRPYHLLTQEENDCFNPVSFENIFFWTLLQKTTHSFFSIGLGHIILGNIPARSERFRDCSNDRISTGGPLFSSLIFQ